MPRIDLFELVDGLFRGIVYFFYNIFETIVQLARRPFRGPVRLYRRRIRPGVRQLAGPTFLFLAFFAFFATRYAFPQRPRLIIGGMDAPPTIAAELTNALADTPSIDVDWLWLVLATSLTATVIVDATLRLALSSPGFGSRGRRALVLEGVEYALFWPIILLLSLSLREKLYPFERTTTRFSVEAPDPSFLPVFLLAMMPAALLLAAGLRWGRRSAGRRVPLRLAALLAVTATMFGASLAAARLGNRIEALRDQKSQTWQGPLVPYLDCALAGADPHVDAVIWNRGPDAVVEEAEDFTLHIAIFPETVFRSDQEIGDARSYPVDFDDPPGPTILLQPGEARRIRLRVPSYSYGPIDAGKACALEVDGRSVPGAELQRFPLGGVPDRIDPPPFLDGGD